GQRQRVAVGAALCRQAGVLLFDEPLSNLDAKLRVHMRTELKRLHQRVRTTSVYVTHDQVEAMTMGDRIVIMNGGKIMQVATPLRHDVVATARCAAGTFQLNAEIHEKLKAQQQIDLWFDLSRAYLFDKESECAL